MEMNSEQNQFGSHSSPLGSWSCSRVTSSPASLPGSAAAKRQPDFFVTPSGGELGWAWVAQSARLTCFFSCRRPFGRRLKSQRRRSSNFFCRQQLCTVFRLKYRSRFFPLCFSQPLFFSPPPRAFCPPSAADCSLVRVQPEAGSRVRSWTRRVRPFTHTRFSPIGIAPRSIRSLWTNHVWVYKLQICERVGDWSNRKTELESAERGWRRDTDKAVFNERGMCMLGIFMTI